MTSLRLVLAAGVAAVLLAGCGEEDATTSSTTAAPSTTGVATSTSEAPSGPVTFTLTIENVSDGSDTPTPLAPGLVLLLDDGDEALFVPGEPAGDLGLEALSEDGDPTALAAATGAETFQAEEGGYEAGPLLPGDEFVIELIASPGQRLTFANMFGQSNDWFFATVPVGIELFDGGAPISGEITDQVRIWDAGTEVDQPIGEGPDQAPRQAAPNTGAADPDPVVREVSTAGGHVRVTLAPKG